MTTTTKATERQISYLSSLRVKAANKAQTEYGLNTSERRDSGIVYGVPAVLADSLAAIAFGSDYMTVAREHTTLVKGPFATWLVRGGHLPMTAETCGPLWAQWLGEYRHALTVDLDSLSKSEASDLIDFLS